MLVLLALQFAAGAVAPLLVRRLRTRAFLALALAPLVVLAWALTKTAAVRDGDVLVETVRWVPVLDLELALAMGTLQWVMTLIVSGIGALVLFYLSLIHI